MPRSTVPQSTVRPQQRSHHRYTILLIALVTLFVTTPLAATTDHPLVAQALRSVTFSLVVVTAVFVVLRDARSKVIILTLAFAAIVAGLIDEATPEIAIQVGSHLLTIGLLACTIALIPRALLTARQVDYNILAASLCVYALIVVLWAALFSLLEMFSPGAFNYAPSTENPVMRFGSGDASVALYFSLVTITTLGYGDVVPLTPAARSLAALEAFFGQAFVAILVARLVGLHIVSTEDRRKG